MKITRRIIIENSPNKPEHTKITLTDEKQIGSHVTRDTVQVEYAPHEFLAVDADVRRFLNEGEMPPGKVRRKSHWVLGAD